MAGEPKPVEAMKQAPHWELQGLDGKTIQSSDYKGKVMALVFWATWCPPFRAEIPGFIELQKKIRRTGIHGRRRFCR